MAKRLLSAVAAAALAALVAVALRNAPPKLEDTALDEAKFARFRAWILEQGGTGPGGDRWRAARSPIGGYGLFTDDALAEGAAMVHVPLTLMLTGARAPAGALDHPAITAAIAEPDLAGILPLALALLRERAAGNSSKWAPYIATMSTETPSYAALADEIKGSDLEVHLARRNTLDALAASAVEQALGAEMRDGLAWALATVRSRAILLTTQSASETSGGKQNRAHTQRDTRWCPDGDLCPALVPLMDLLNHQFEDEARTTGTEAWRESYVWRASRHFAAGDEVLWSYGPKPSSALLLSYGFVVDDNPNEAVSVFMNVKKDEPTADARREVLRAAAAQLGSAHQQPQPGADGIVRFRRADQRSGPIGLNDLAVARTLTCPTAALKGAQAALIAGRPVSKSNELDALNLLRKMASYRLEGYAGGSAEDDDARLAAGTGSAAWRMVVRMRRAEKRLLRGALREIDRRISRVAKDGIGAVRRPPKPSERAAAGT